MDGKRVEHGGKMGENVGLLLSWEKCIPGHICVVPIYQTKEYSIPALDSWELFF